MSSGYSRRTIKNKRVRQIENQIMVGGAICVEDDRTNKFDHPDEINTWFENDANKKKFFYGIGSILKGKEEAMDKQIGKLTKEIQLLNDGYINNEKNYEQLIEESQKTSATEMKDALQEHIREQLNKSYETKYSESLIKKQAYDMVKTAIINRRWYIVGDLKKKEGGTIIENIKKEAAKIYNFYRGPRYVKIRTELFSMLKTIADSPAMFDNSFVLNTSIVGPAGSGKTTMARAISRWYAALGILTYDSFYQSKSGELSIVEVSRSNLIGEYTGQTAPKTLGVLAINLEKTLFIDEAYSVTGCSFDAQNKVEPDAYGEEFLATLLLFMNDHKGFNAILVAGYETQMRKCFFERNEGLPRRFPRQITLPFYSTDELFGIFAANVTRKLTAAEKNAIDAMPDKDAAEKTEKTTQEVKLKELESACVTKLSLMKPSFYMIHCDTSSHSLDYLRKYLLSIQMRLCSKGKNVLDTADLAPPQGRSSPQSPAPPQGRSSSQGFAPPQNPITTQASSLNVLNPSDNATVAEAPAEEEVEPPRTNTPSYGTSASNVAGGEKRRGGSFKRGLRRDSNHTGFHGGAVTADNLKTEVDKIDFENIFGNIKGNKIFTELESKIDETGTEADVKKKTKMLESLSNYVHRLKEYVKRSTKATVAPAILAKTAVSPVAKPAMPTTVTPINLHSVYSYTILAQLFINLLDTECRKQLLRRHFYKEVYGFEGSNMSYFPAQAGEMENFADQCVILIGDKIKATDKFLPICDEQVLVNRFLETKKIKVNLFELNGEYNSDKLPIPKRYPCFHELMPSNMNCWELQTRISDFFMFDKFFTDCLPSLTDMYDILTTPEKRSDCIKHVLNIYMHHNSVEYMTDLLELSEKEFPIHITKPDLEQEISELKYVDRYLSAFKGVEKVLKSGNKADLDALEKNFEDLKRDKTFVESQVKGREKATKLSEAIVAFATDKKYTGTFLANPKFTKDPVGPITLSDILYEDIGVSSTFTSGIAQINKDTYESYSLGFLSTVLPNYGAFTGTVTTTEKCDGGFSVDNIDANNIDKSLEEIRATKEELRRGDLTVLGTNADVFNKVEVPVYERTKVKEFARKWDSDMYLSLARERDRLEEDLDKL